jgi:minor extracellular serine protease Vpr
MKLFYFLFVLTFCESVLAQSNLDNASKLALNNPNLLLVQNKTVPALIQVNAQCTPEELLQYGIVVNSKIGNIWSVMIPEKSLSLLSSIKTIEYAELSSFANAARFKNDLERQLTQVDKVQNGLQNSLPKNYSGKGVIVGIVDVGFQCNNPTFYTADGKNNRIIRYWQQNNNNGTAPAGYSYGTEFSDSAVIAGLNDMDGTHGTHVAGIAVGSGYSTPGLQYRGVAPEAEIILVTIKYTNDTLPGSALGDYIVANPTIIDAYKYIFDYAESVGKPAVINLSWGMHTGPHDGTSLFDRATELLVGKGKILIGANGNEGDNPMHFYHKFNKDTAATIMIENGRQWRQGESVYSDFWGSKKSHFSIKVQFIDTNKTIIAETPFISSNKDTSIQYKFNADTSVFNVHFAVNSNYINNNKPSITVSADHKKQRKYAIIAFICSDSSEVHGWNSGAARDWTSGSFRNKLNQLNFESSFIAGDAAYTAGENGGTSKAVISVGAIAARTSYTNVKGKFINDSWYTTPPSIARFSSRGPTVDGRIKPNVTAPGYNVPSSLNNKQLAGWMIDRTLLKSVFKNDTQYWAAFSGTSMAAPHVAGIVALLLQANPNLTATQVKDILESTADEDQSTGSVPNNTYGYGRVNAYSAIIRALQLSSVNSLNVLNAPAVYPNPVSDVLTVAMPGNCSGKISICDMQGRVISELDVESDKKYQIDTQQLSQGIYFVNFRNGGELFAWKLVKN